MALKDQKEYAQATSTSPAFETEAETVGVATKEAVKETQKVADPVAAASVAATTATSKASAGAVSTQVRSKLVVALAGHKDIFDTSTVSALSMATPRITGEQGSLKKNRSVKVGTNLHLEVISWNHRWALGCGEQTMNDEMKQLFRVSYDNKTIDGEACSVEDYINYLKSQGYDKARVSPYIDLFGYITWTKDGGDIAPDDRELVLVQLSSTSMGNFTAFCVSRGLLESRGVVQPSEMIEIIAEDNTKGSMSYTNMNFKAVK